VTVDGGEAAQETDEEVFLWVVEDEALQGGAGDDVVGGGLATEEQARDAGHGVTSSGMGGRDDGKDACEVAALLSRVKRSQPVPAGPAISLSPPDPGRS